MKAAKNLSVVLIVCASLLLGNARASFASSDNFTILSGWHRVWGSAWGWTYNSYSEQWDSYDTRISWDGSGLSGRAELSPWLWAWSYSEALYAAVASDASYRPDSISAAHSGVEAEWLFRPRWGWLAFHVDDLYAGPWGADPVIITLTDQTTGQRIFSYDGVSNRMSIMMGWILCLHDAYGSYDHGDLLPIDPSHEYLLYINLFGTTSGDGPYGQALRFAVVPTPDAILLGTLGAGLVGLLRRRKML